MKNTLGKKLRQLRIKSGLSQKKFAEKIVASGLKTHLTIQQISYYESVKFTNFDTFVEFCKVLNFEVELSTIPLAEKLASETGIKKSEIEKFISETGKHCFGGLHNYSYSQILDIVKSNLQ